MHFFQSQHSSFLFYQATYHQDSSFILLSLRTEQSAMEQKPRKTKEPQQNPMTHVLNWARHVSSACLQQLARPATTGPLLFTCLCLALAYKYRNRKWGPKEAAAAPVHVLHRSLSMAALHGGNVALERIMDSQEARIDQPALESAAKTFQRLLDEEPLSINMLQMTAAKLEMSGKEDEAVKMLQKALEEAEKEGKTHEAYELQMLLAEMLIYKGNYEDALKCKCLNDKVISDARGPLYQAVIYLIEGDINRAKECYQVFQDIRSRFHWPDADKEGSPLYGAVHDFQIFKRIVSNLKREINHAHKMKQACKAKA